MVLVVEISTKIKIILTCCLLLSGVSYGQKSSIYTEDIDHFWAMYDRVLATKDTQKQLFYVQTLYLNKASAGLKDFMRARGHSAELHLNNIFKYPKFWASIRSKTWAIKSHTDEIEKIISNFKNQYPDFETPEFYFTMGVLNSGGTISGNKVIIGSEIACADSTVVVTELGKWLQGVIKLNTSVVSIVAHEIGHTQQTRYRKTNLLGACIREGACDFMAELMYKPVPKPYMYYGNQHESDLWDAFQKVMLGEETKDWLYNGDNAPNGIADLGYFIGYKICSSYYENSINKKQALKEIIELKYRKKSVYTFLVRSKYQGGKK